MYCSCKFDPHTDRLSEPESPCIQHVIPEDVCPNRRRTSRAAGAQIDINNLKGQDADYNAKKIIEIFSGVKNEFYEAVSLNAAAALVVSNKIHKFEDGFDLAKKQLESGKVLTHLKKIQTL